MECTCLRVKMTASTETVEKEELVKKKRCHISDFDIVWLKKVGCGAEKSYLQDVWSNCDRQQKKHEQFVFPSEVKACARVCGEPEAALGSNTCQHRRRQKRFACYPTAALHCRSFFQEYSVWQKEQTMERHNKSPHNTLVQYYVTATDL